MKNQEHTSIPFDWRRLTLTATLFTLVSLTFSFCVQNKNNENQEQSNIALVKNETPQNLDTDLDKYLGMYEFGNHFGFYSVGKFPINSKVHTEHGDKYPALDQKFIGKYFIVSNSVDFQTSKVADFAGGYIAPPVGDIITGISKDGDIFIQNYNNYGKTGDSPMVFNVVGEPHAYGKFIKRADGHYNLSINNALYELKKSE